jgi:hypothetical protein
MAEQIISPGVFTRENDLSFLPQGVGAIGAAIIGPTVKGPAFVPTVVRSFQEFENRFGPLSSDTYVPQTIREYLKNAGSVTVTRILAGGGYTFSTGNIEPLGVIIGSGTAAAAVFATGSLVIADSFFQDEGDELQITNPAGTEFRIIAADPAALPADDTDAGIFFASTGSSDATVMTNLAAKLSGTVATTIGVAATSGSGAAGLEFTASVAGTSGNGFTFETGSGDTISTDSGVSTLGGTNATLEGGVLAGLIYPAKATGTPTLNTSAITPSSGHVITSSFGITLNGSGVTSTTFTASVNPSNVDYLFKYIGYNADTSRDGASSATAFDGMPGYTYLNFKNFQTNALATDDLTGYSGIGSGSVLQIAKMSSNNQVFDGIGKIEGYGYSSTPFIQSQIAQGQKDLFAFHTIDHGRHLCHEYKISIANLKEPSDINGVEQYSTFSVLVRKTNDTDKTPIILEQYNNVNLDPNSPNYISRRIGDRYPEYNEVLNKVELLGNYPNISKYIRVEASEAVANGSLSPKLSPKGFKAVKNTFNTGSLDVNCTFPSASYEGVQQIGTDLTYNPKGFLGFKFLDKDSDNENFLQPLPNSAETNIAGNFSVENYSGHPSSSLWSGSLSASIDTTGADGPTNSQLKFTVPFQGGDDGLAPWTIKKIGSQIENSNLYGFDLSTTNATGYKAYKKALDILSNQDEYDINMLAMPGVIHSLHPLVTNAGIDMVEGRGDAFFVMDLSTVDSSVNTAVSNVSGLDTNYAAVYYPWVKVLDSSVNRPVLVPPSVIVPGAIAASDRIGAEWFAPAGLNRGILGNVLEAKVRLNQNERDTLYDAKINPIATFPATGVCIWGQKTLQERSTALDRINVRRLLISLKKFIASSSRFLVFEQNTTQTRNRFLNIVNPYLESVQSRQGLFAFRVQMDGGNNTPDVIDRNQLVGAIYLQPTKTAEFIVLDFNVLPTGATFDGGGGATGGGATGGSGGGGY